MIEAKRGEPPIHIGRIFAFPSDARRVLHIRDEVYKEMRQQGGRKTPIDDLIIEDRREDLRREGEQVVHPIAFLLPNVFLEVLARL